MKLLVIGSGGREHALAWRLKQSPRLQKVYVAPGNGGTAREEGVENVAITGIPELVEFALKEGIQLTVVGPEAPLAAGVVDAFRAAGLKIFGPTQAAAQLESSKDFAKQFMARHTFPPPPSPPSPMPPPPTPISTPRARPSWSRPTAWPPARAWWWQQTAEEAHAAVDMPCSPATAWARPAHRVVIEECLVGEEASFIVMVDGEHVLPLATSQDHKRLLDGDQGPNTGGMGAYSPAPVVTPEIHAKVMREVIRPVVAGMKAEGTPYTGFLYAGLMIGPDGKLGCWNSTAAWATRKPSRS
jgi:phosphoribosylamine--glycine ligase